MTRWDIYLSVPVHSMEEWRRINEMADKVDPKSAGAGTGFGCRDIDWIKPNKAEALALKLKLENVFKRMNGQTKIYRQK